MNKTVKSSFVNLNLLEKTPKLLEDCIVAHRVELFKDLHIEDNQPIILTFRSTDMSDLRNLCDPLGNIELITTVNIEYPATKHVFITKSINKTYKEYASFWQKLKLLFSKKPIYTKETKEV